jgi:3-oxoacyl-(acyl-carrier-protein) synthase
MPAPAAKMAGRFSQFAVAAAKMALDDSGLDVAAVSPTRLLIAIGTSMGGLVDVEQPNFEAFLAGAPVAPWTVLEFSAHAAASRIAMDVSARGQASTMSSACTAGLDAIRWAAEKIESNKATVVVAGGSEASLSPAVLDAFRALGALSKWQGPAEAASRPFDRLRSGLVLAEGAAIVIVEDLEFARSRGAQIYASLSGAASATEAIHMRQIDTSGAAAAESMRQALQAACRLPQDVDYICAHGNSLLDYDAAETAGIKAALGRHAWSCPVSSIKSMCGQSLAAAGPMQVVASCLAIRDHVIPPTINYDFPDPQCDLDYVPNRARSARLNTTLIHAQSIGGCHTALTLTRCPSR